MCATTVTRPSRERRNSQKVMKKNASTSSKQQNSSSNNKTTSIRDSREAPSGSIMTNHHRMQFGCVNVTTCKDDDKLTQCAMVCSELGHEVCFMTETHKIGAGTIDEWPENAELDGWSFTYSGQRRKAEAGVGILCGPNAELIDSSTVIEGRILHARLKVYGLKINAWCVYAPTNVKSESTKAKFFCELRKSVRAMRKKFPSWKIMISGDLNSTLGPDAPKSKFVGNNNVGEYPTTDMGYRLCDFLSDEKLYALNTLFQTKPSHRITWKLGRTAKRLDYFITDYFLRQYTRHCMQGASSAKPTIRE